MSKKLDNLNKFRFLEFWMHIINIDIWKGWAKVSVVILFIKMSLHDNRVGPLKRQIIDFLCKNTMNSFSILRFDPSGQVVHLDYEFVWGSLGLLYNFYW